MSWADFDLNVEQMILERMPVAATTAVTRQAVFSLGPMPIADALVARLESHVLTQKLVGDTKEVTVSVNFPATPWQFFKERHLGWLHRLSPVRYKERTVSESVTFERYATYPHADFAPADRFGAPVIVERYVT